MVVMIGSNKTIDDDSSPEISTACAETGKVGQKRQRLHVTFSEEVRSRPTYSSDEVQGCWYSHDDYHMFRHGIYQTVELAKCNIYIDEVRFSQRGLEKYSVEADRERRQVQQKARFVVIKRQEVGERKGDSTSLADSISQFYATETRSASMAAYLTGIADERYVRLSTSAEEDEEDETNVPVVRPRATRVGLPPKPVERRTIISLAA